MKTSLILTVVCFALVHGISVNAQAQPETMIYLNDQMNSCQKKKATYYTTTVPVEDRYEVFTYFMDGSLKMSGYSKDADGKILDGPQTFYHKSGVIESQGEYDTGKKVGVWKRYSESGMAKADKFYSPREVNGPIHEVADKMPQFKGGQKELTNWIKETLIYPDLVLEKGIEGKVELSFVVDEMGDVTDVRIVEGLTRELNMEALRVMNEMPSWIPGRVDGNSAKVQMKLPLVFEIE